LKGWIKINGFITILWEWLRFVHKSSYLFPFIHRCHIIFVQSLSVMWNKCLHCMLWMFGRRRYWNNVLGNGNMTVNLLYIYLSNKQMNMNEWTLNSHYIYIAYVKMSFPAFKYYDAMNIPCNITQFCNHHSVVIQCNICNGTCIDRTPCIRQATLFQRITYIMLDE
jgi:hypothetical protein